VYKVYRGLHQNTLYLTDEVCQLTDVEARQRLRSSSFSSLIVSRTEYLLLVAELSRSPLLVSGIVFQILSFRNICSSLLVPVLKSSV